MQKLEFIVTSSLEKVFLDQRPAGCELVGHESILRGESYAFQIAMKGLDADEPVAVLVPEAVGENAVCMTVRQVKCVPSELPAYAAPRYDEGYLRTAPGLYPDLLDDITKDNPLAVENTAWKSVWVEYTPTADTPAGEKELSVRFVDTDGNDYGTVSVKVALLEAALDAQELIYTEWFHCDCIATWYGVQPLSDAHFALLEKYIRNAVRNGINMLLTPVFTPPLDTAVGGERPTVQLVGVTRENGRYTFDFSLLERFVRMCEDCGVRYFEISHLFTQWGARFAPKVMATDNGEYRRIFGWETDAASPEYREFLSALLPQLVAELKRLGIAERCYFHVSDEPSLEAMDSYSSAAEFLKPYVEGFKTFDALSNYEFYKSGLINTPVCSSDHIQPFLEAGVPNLWTYYCCGQTNKVSNRFFAMPGLRTRIIGVQLYRYDIKGFLQWGFNFWYSQYSVRRINPFVTTDAGMAFPSGDAFVVYPGEDGPLESLRERVFAQGLDDLRSLRTLERLKGREYTLALLEDELGEITFENCAYTDEQLLKLRIRINAEIAG
ncbi:MAG: DUF4091 domain-containing protein [Clostridia bacterium]|nr:DUF4091 domain-containing protein [Clostridia bacterium]